MGINIEYYKNKATENEIYEHIIECSNDFTVPLHMRVNLKTYAGKIFHQTVSFEAYDKGKLIGLIGVYCNDYKNKVSFITHISVDGAYRNQSVGMTLLSLSVNDAKEKGFLKMKLEVHEDNHKVQKFYMKKGFVTEEKVADQHRMVLLL